MFTISATPVWQHQPLLEVRRLITQVTNPVPNDQEKPKGRKILEQREQELLKGSDVIREYPDLQRWLMEAPLTDELVSTLSEAEQQFIDNVLPAIVAQASAEWRSEGNVPLQDMGSARIPCRLCNTPNRWVYYLVNRINDNRMNVGSECVTHFGIETGVTGMTKAELRREAAVVWRRSVLDKAIPGIHRLVYDWSNHLDEYRLIIPHSLDKPYRDLGGEVRELYDAFIKTDKATAAQSAKDAEMIYALRALIDKRPAVIAAMERYVDEHRNHRFAAHSKYATWLRRHDRQAETAIDWLKHDGQVTHRTIHRITEPSLMSMIVPDLKAILKPIGFRVTGVDDQKHGYVLVSTKHPKLPVRLFAAHGELLLRCGGIMFGEPNDVTFEDVFELTMTADRKSSYVVWGELIPLLHSRGIEPRDMSSLHDFDEFFPEIALYDKGAGRYLLMSNLDSVVGKFKGLAFDVGSKSVDQLVATIAGPDVTHLTYAALKQMYEERKASKRRHR